MYFDLFETLMKRCHVNSWICVKGQQEVLLATYIGNQFVVVNNTGRPINFVPNAGIDLPGVTSADKGKYSVRIYLRGDLIYSQTAILQVIGNLFNACLCLWTWYSLH